MRSLVWSFRENQAQAEAAPPLPVSLVSLTLLTQISKIGTLVKKTLVSLYAEGSRTF